MLKNIIQFLYSIKKMLSKIKASFTPERNYAFYSHLSPKKYEKEQKRAFKIAFGKKLTRKNVKTFNEKIQWLRCYDNIPIKTILADKYRVRDYVKKQVGEKYLIKLLGVWDNFDEIDFSKLPESFVLKANHGCGWNILVTDKKTLNIEKAKQDMEKWLKTNYAFYFLELQYRNIPPKIIAEEFISNSNNNLYDYKVHCFNGHPKYIQFIGDRMTPPTQEIFLDRNWTPQPFTYTYPKYETIPQKPVCLNELLSIAEKLAADFAYVRVDFYVLNDNSIRFGEMTFTPAGGMDHWTPPEWNLKLGNLLKLPAKED